ncbi:LOW QUALITY PROTEIN: hypothetical protein Cgig2_026749 [Carnegiea gigantea]|uniref:Uncharacterized protein n=1 Tax=Carnegiea gigantea TaxID=171969 RepID=A0A9Q1JUB1_9CARY|nr:LOW QUALITY PROTEIN: hypothetical protein Cgig2_026749 [Carnegiea gigantea]
MSLQLIRHVPTTLILAASRGGRYDELGRVGSHCGAAYLDEIHDRHSIAGLTLVEVFVLSIFVLISHGDHIYEYFLQDDFSPWVDSLFGWNMDRQKPETNEEKMSASTSPRKIWVGFLNNVSCERESSNKVEPSLINVKRENADAGVFYHDCESEDIRQQRCPEGPEFNYDLPQLNDEDLRAAIQNFESAGASAAKQTNYAFGFQFSESQYLCPLDDAKFLESILLFQQFFLHVSCVTWAPNSNSCLQIHLTKFFRDLISGGSSEFGTLPCPEEQHSILTNSPLYPNH